MAHWRPRVQTGSTGSMTLSPSGGGATEQSYAAKVVTYIPAEIIATYQAAVGVVPDSAPKALAWVGIILLIITPLWTAYAATDKNERLPWFQALAACVAFAIWLLSVQNPAVGFVFSDPNAVPGYVRTLVLIGAGLGFPLIENILKYYKIPV